MQIIKENKTKNTLPFPVSENHNNGRAVTEGNDCEVKVEHLQFFYGRKQALFDINIEAQEKGVTALIGPSGCGKTTFLRVLNRMNDLVPDTHLEG
ncbi:MAG TPA: ATP-binding cassette domain-containing protein, partial [Firmicutes bacterium]|nr:ATP-binding cassette domain-containing protein [Bacillota bacterium]